MGTFVINCKRWRGGWGKETHREWERERGVCEKREGGGRKRAGRPFEGIALSELLCYIENLGLNLYVFRCAAQRPLQVSDEEAELPTLGRPGAGPSTLFHNLRV